jgi:tRNA threonylcarbamoyladenosine biosynthesis protein TsaE
MLASSAAHALAHALAHAGTDASAGTHDLLRSEWPDESACAADAQALAEVLRSSMPRGLLAAGLVTLAGDLGSGKTTFARHLLRGLGVTHRIKSPTYALVETHEGADGLPIHHLDLYRFADPGEWPGSGLPELLAEPALVLVEWPERAGTALAAPDLAISIAMPISAEDPLLTDADVSMHRQVRVQAHTERGRGWLVRWCREHPAAASEAAS